MSRPLKQGLDYFYLDTNMDEKVLVLEAKHGLIGFAIFVKLLQRIYKEGYYCKFDDKEKAVFCKEHNINIETLEAVLEDCLRERIFDGVIYAQKQILTSSGIQKRYFRITKRRGKIDIREDILKIDISAIMKEDNECVEDDEDNQDDLDKKRGKSNEKKEEKLKLFEEFWKEYPTRNGKKLLKAEARRYFLNSIKNKDIPFLMQAVKNYAKSSIALRGFARDAIRFLRNDYWRDWVEPEDVFLKRNSVSYVDDDRLNRIKMEVKKFETERNRVSSATES